MKAIIIGATSGIGREVALKLLEEGWELGIAGRRTAELEAIKELYGVSRVKIAAIDVTSESATGALDTLLEETGAPDWFLHVSGVGYQSGPLDEEKELRTVMTNAVGSVRMISHFLNYVKLNADVYKAPGRKKVRIGIVSSIAGTAGLGAAPAYSATKRMQSHYISALSQFVRMEKMPVRFTDIRPGFVATALLSSEKKYPMLIKPEKAAKYIVRGLHCGRRVVTFDWRYRALVFFWRLIPRPLWERLTWVNN
ncbi:MAG: SDR family NAD(P)-dependent oxidoreductase [Bacteroidales bacterium]|nr:SDR family NAD(P)-dependent oxidoreductase [Bacteroidales bacterium]